MFSAPSSMLFNTLIPYFLITFRGMEKIEVYSNRECIQNRVVREFGDRLQAFPYGAVCRVLETPMWWC